MNPSRSTISTDSAAYPATAEVCSTALFCVFRGRIRVHGSIRALGGSAASRLGSRPGSGAPI